MKGDLQKQISNTRERGEEKERKKNEGGRNRGGEEGAKIDKRYNVEKKKQGERKHGKKCEAAKTNQVTEQKERGNEGERDEK